VRLAVVPDFEKAAPLLFGRLEEFAGLAPSVMGGMWYRGTSPIGRMSYAFLEKQAQHATAVVRLGNHADGALVARSMLEGLWQMEWALTDPDARSQLWWDFIYVKDWRVLMDRDATGVVVDDERRACVLQRIGLYGDKFKVGKPGKGKSFATNETSYPDPYAKDWHALRVRDLAEAADDLLLYRTAYARFSERHHWDTSDATRSTVKLGQLVFSQAPSAQEYCGVLAISFLCLFRMSRSINDHFARGFDAELQAQLDLWLTAGRDAGLKLSLRSF
jgi:hypothetical protein